MLQKKIARYEGDEVAQKRAKLVDTIYVLHTCDKALCHLFI